MKPKSIVLPVFYRDGIVPLLSGWYRPMLFHEVIKFTNNQWIYIEFNKTNVSVGRVTIGLEYLTIYSMQEVEFVTSLKDRRINDIVDSRIIVPLKEQRFDPLTPKEIVSDYFMEHELGDLLA